MNNTPQPGDTKNLLIAFGLSVVILFIWQLSMPTPQRIVPQDAPAYVAAKPDTALTEINKPVEPEVQARRLTVDNGYVKGSISTQGLRLDDLILPRYRQTVDPTSPPVELLQPKSKDDMYMAEFGWVSANPRLALPSNNTVWNGDATRLEQDKGVSFRWDNGSGLVFERTIALDDRYMFTVTQRVINQSNASHELQPYGLVNRQHDIMGQEFLILHEGAFGVFNGQLEEVSYSDLKEDAESKSFTSKGGWTGIGDKYWFTALVPYQGRSFTSEFKHYTTQGHERYQVDYLGDTLTVTPGETVEISTNFFAGPKELSLLDSYGKSLDIPLFDRAVDFGVLYFMTKPIFKALEFFYGIVGNFGIAILLLTVAVKLILFPLANKSYHAMASMKELQPKLMEIREKHAEDPMKLNGEMMKLYKSEKVNPAAGCLPILIQIPVFFALYKVLFVTIEMRHAPFYGWVDDLSAPDMSNIFTGFGLFEWSHPDILWLGAWPILMALSMVVQQQIFPKPSDPMQEKIMKLFPLMLLVVCARFPVGLVIYWTWNNVLSITQQLVIMYMHKRKTNKAAKA